MARAGRLIQNAFTAGELSPRMYGRTDFEKYGSGLEKLRNWLIMPQGGIITRPGTRFVGEVKDSTKQTVLFPFEFSDEQAYQIETGDQYLRFYKDHGRIEVVSTGTAITNGSFPTDISGWTNKSGGTGTFTWDATNKTGKLTTNATPGTNFGACEQQITVAAGDQAKKHVIRFRIFNGQCDVKVGTTSGGAELFARRTVKRGFHTISVTPGTSPIYLGFIKDDAAGTAEIDDVTVLSNVPLELTSPYSHLDVHTLQQAQSADIQWWTSDLYKPRELKRYSDVDWSLEEYTPTSDPFTSIDNYPAGVAFLGQRLWFGGTALNPQKIWATQIDDYQSLDPGTSLDDEAIEHTLASGKINKIKWLLGADVLVIGTLGGEFIGRGDASNKITPASFNTRSYTTHGVSGVQPVRISTVTLFIQRQLRKIRQIAYDFNVDAFIAPDLTVLSEHVTESGIVNMVYQQEPDTTVWLVRTDGKLVTLTYLLEQKVAGFAIHATDVAEGDKFKWVSAIPAPTIGTDEVWVIVERTVNGSVKRYIEYFDQQAGFYGQLNTDSALEQTFGGPVSSVSGLDHLEGRTVAIVGDGAYLADAVVSGGAVSLPSGSESTQVEVGLKRGLPFAKGLRPEILGAATIQGATVARGESYVRVKDTITVTVDDVEVPDRSTEDMMDQPPAPFTGDVPVPGALGWGREDEGQIEISQPLPLPATVLAIMGTIYAGED